MDVQRLQAFRSVVATGSVRGAAEALGYSPAAISQQVTRLQRETGVALLAKAGRGLEPTPNGLALARRIDEYLAEAAELDDYIAGLRAGRGSVCTVRYFSSLGVTWLPTIIATLLVEFPDTRVDLRISDEHDPREVPRADVQFVVARPGEATPGGYRSVEIARDPYVAALPDAHPLSAHEGPLPLALLRDEPWIDLNSAQGGCRQVVLDACAAAGFQPLHRVQSHDYPMALAFVAAGVGVTVLPRLGAAACPGGVALRELAAPVPVRRIVALVSGDAATAPLAGRIVTLARELSATASPI